MFSTLVSYLSPSSKNQAVTGTLYSRLIGKPDWIDQGKVNLKVVDTAWTYSKQLRFLFIEEVKKADEVRLIEATMNYQIVDGGFTYYMDQRIELKFIYNDQNHARKTDLEICRAIFSQWHKTDDKDNIVVDWVRELKVQYPHAATNLDSTEGSPTTPATRVENSSNEEDGSDTETISDSHEEENSDTETIVSNNLAALKLENLEPIIDSITQSNLETISNSDTKSKTKSESISTLGSISTSGSIGNLEITRSWDENLDGDTICRAPGDYFKYDDENNEFVSVKTSVLLVITNIYPDSEKRFLKKLYIVTDLAVLSVVELTSAISLKFYQSAETESIIWVTKEPATELWSFVFRGDKDSFPQFKQNIVQALYEHTKQEPFPTNLEEQSRILSIFDESRKSSSFSSDEDDDQGSIVSSDQEDTDKTDDTGNSDDEKKETDECDDTDTGDETDEEDSNSKPRGVKNSLLTVGRKSDRSFVVRGNTIGVFKRGNHGLKYTTTIKKIMSPSKKMLFSPNVAMLHEEDTSLLMLNPANRSTIYKMDLNMGKVVEEYDTEELTPLGLLPEKKHAQRESVKTFLALNSGGLFVVDPRLPKGKVNKHRTFQYQNVRNALIKCGATTNEGHIVVGTKSGEIRMFDSSTLRPRRSASYVDYAPRAKNSLPGLGDPILAMDVTADGNWILATCREYLLVIPTQSSLDSSISGWEKQLGQNKPRPRRLALKHADIVKVGEVNFTPAKFNYSGEETTICTSTENWLISWNFKQVQRNVLDVYLMKKYCQRVVANDFTHDTDKNIIVAMPDDVRLAKTSKKEIKE